MCGLHQMAMVSLLGNGTFEQNLKEMVSYTLTPFGECSQGRTSQCRSRKVGAGKQEAVAGAEGLSLGLKGRWRDCGSSSAHICSKELLYCEAVLHSVRRDLGGSRQPRPFR